MLTVFVRSNLQSFGPTMDGDDYIAPVFFCVAEADDGRRFRHFHREPSAYIEDDADWGFHHVNIADQAEARAEALAERMREFETLSLHDPRYWREIEPRYGSPAYMECNEFGGDGAPLR